MNTTSRLYRRILLLIILGLTGTWANAETIHVRLFYAGQPLVYLSKPEFSLRTPQDWVSMTITPNPDGSFTLERPAPGNYMIHVVIDEDKSNPGDFPGDYNIFQEFKVTETEPAELIVHLSKMIRITQPWDNGTGIDGMLAAPVAQQPLLKMPRFATKRAITFAWDPIANGALYVYTLSRAKGDSVTQLFQKETPETSVTLTLSPSNPDETYRFNLFAKKSGQTVGTLFVHDSGVQGWALHFRVGQPWISFQMGVVALGLLLIGVLAARRFTPPVASLATVILLLSFCGYLYHADRAWQKESSQPSSNPVTAGRPGVDRSVVEAFKQTVPLPAWWNTVEPGLPIHSYSDLQSIWMSGGTMDAERGKHFYKSAYQAIDQHPEIPDLVPQALYLMSVVAADANTVQALDQFWVDHFFAYQQRTDNCANCLVGDLTGEMVRAYAETLQSTNPSAGIALIEKLVKERDKDISPYNWALTFQTMARNQWQMCDKSAALASLNEGLRRFPSGWQADQLRKTQTDFEQNVPTRCVQ